MILIKLKDENINFTELPKSIAFTEIIECQNQKDCEILLIIESCKRNYPNKRIFISDKIIALRSNSINTFLSSNITYMIINNKIALISGQLESRLSYICLD